MARGRIGRGIDGTDKQSTIYSLASSTTPFDPDRDPARYVSNQVVIFGFN